jgi:hypothetical protein
MTTIFESTFEDAFADERRKFFVVNVQSAACVGSITPTPRLTPTRNRQIVPRFLSTYLLRQWEPLWVFN